MENETEDEASYRFAAFGARGTIHLTKGYVRTETWSYLGRWAQAIPLEHISPNHGTLTTRPPIYIWAWILAILFVWFGIYGMIWGVAAFPQKLVGGVLVLGGIWLAWYLYNHRTVEWIIFPTTYPNQGVNYTRQGPDQGKCDAFTKQLVDAINAQHRARGTHER